MHETSKPVLFGDKLLIPSGMSAWDAVQFLPEDIRQQTQAGFQHKVSEVYVSIVKQMRARLSTMEAEEAGQKRFNSFSYPAQMAIAETIVRQQFGMPEIGMRELVTRHGGQLHDDQDHLI